MHLHRQGVFRMQTSMCSALKLMCRMFHFGWRTRIKNQCVHWNTSMPLCYVWRVRWVSKFNRIKSCCVTFFFLCVCNRQVPTIYTSNSCVWMDVCSVFHPALSRLFLCCITRYDQVMSALGGDGYHATTQAELAAAVSKSFAAKRPALINVVIDPHAGVESGNVHSFNNPQAKLWVCINTRAMFDSLAVIRILTQHRYIRVPKM